MTKRIFRSITLVAAVVLLASFIVTRRVFISVTRSISANLPARRSCAFAAISYTSGRMSEIFICISVVFYLSSMTMDLKYLPRSAKFLKRSKAAQAGENSTISPALAASAAALTACLKSSIILTSSPLPS